jgi:hypothetical protein
VIRARSILVLAMLAAPAGADLVTLSDGGRLTGSVTALDGDTLKLDSPLSVEPVLLRAGGISQVRFDNGPESAATHDSRMVLTNGDRLPCDLAAITPDSVRVTTGFAGEMDIARGSIATLQLGIRPRKLLYSGPASLKGWIISDGWQLDDGTLVSNGRGAISRTFDPMPDSFSIQFELVWREPPNFQFYFCSTSEIPGGGKLDRYFLQFSAAGFELKRQSSGPATYHTLGAITRRPASFPNFRTTVELRVDLPSRRIEMLLDGEPAGRFDDPLETPPDGKHIIFVGNEDKPGAHRIGNIRLRAWNPAGDRQLGEDRGDSDGDSLIDIDGDRFTGTLIGTAPDDASVILFKSPHHPEPMRIPVERASTIFFTRPDPAAAKSPLVVGLADHGFLGADSCRFGSRKATLAHPLIGEIGIDRSAIRSVLRRETRPEQEDEP